MPANVGKAGASAIQITIIPAVITIEACQSVLTRAMSPDALATNALAESANARTGTSIKLHSIWMAT